MRAVRTLLTGFLLVAAALLSFGALRHRALAAGIIHGDLAYGWLSAHTLAGIWALVLKVLAAVGILGIRESKGRDPRAWIALALGLGLDLIFQTYGYDSWIARAQAAVPPLALAMAVWIFEVPSAQPQASPTSMPAPVPASRVDPPPGSPGQVVPIVPGLRSHRQQAVAPAPSRSGGLTDEQRARVRAMVAEGGWSARSMARELGLSNHARSKHLAPLVAELEAARVGGPGGNGSGP